MFVTISNSWIHDVCDAFITRILVTIMYWRRKKNSEEYMMLYTTVFNMCTQYKPSPNNDDHDYSQHLYDKYRQVVVEYINSTVLPCLRDRHNEFIPREIVKRWVNHKVMTKWLSRFFHYLERFFIARRSIPGLNKVGMMCFRDLVYEELKGKATNAVIVLIEREREIDRSLLKSVVDIFVAIGMGNMECYMNDFEFAMLEDTAGYYSRKASSWIVEDSCPDYMLKAQECLKKEKERVSNYLHVVSETKLLEKARYELLVVYTNQLLEKEHSGIGVLLRDDKVDDLSRMYRLFYKIDKGLVPVSAMFKQHVVAEGMYLVQQADDTTNRQSETPFFVRKVIELYDEYMSYVTSCFSNRSLFHKALKEAFEVFCNKIVSGCSSAELLASYCDNILKKGRSEKLSDESKHNHENYLL